MRQRHGHGRRRGVVGEGQRRRAGQACGIGLAGGHGLRTLRQAGRGEGPDAGSIGGGGAENGRALGQRHGGVGVGGAGQRIIGGDVVGAGVMGQRHGHGRRGGVIGEGQRGAAGQPRGIGLAGGDGLRTLRQAGRGEGPHAASIGGGAAEHGRALAQRHGGVGVGGAGERIVGGDVVGAGGMRQRHGHGRRHGVVGEGQRRRAGQPCGIGLAGGDGLRALGQAGRGEGPDAASALAVVVPRTVEPSVSVTVALASAVPVSASLEVTLLAPVECASAAVTVGATVS